MHIVDTYASQKSSFKIYFRCNGPLKSKLPVSSHFSRDESLVSRDEILVSRDESLVSRDSLKRQFWNKLQANCLARSQLQYCAKVMRANFALFSSKYRRTFDRYFAAFVRQLNEISATIRQGKRKIESKNCFFEFSK